MEELADYAETMGRYHRFSAKGLSSIFIRIFTLKYPCWNRLGLAVLAYEKECISNFYSQWGECD
jgi:hypothetical protein